MAKFDKSKEFGQVIGCPEGRAFEQNGAFFDAQGNPWTAPTPSEPTYTQADLEAAVAAAIAEAGKKK